MYVLRARSNCSGLLRVFRAWQSVLIVGGAHVISGQAESKKCFVFTGRAWGPLTACPVPLTGLIRVMEADQMVEQSGTPGGGLHAAQFVAPVSEVYFYPSCRDARERVTPAGSIAREFWVRQLSDEVITMVGAGAEVSEG